MLKIHFTLSCHPEVEHDLGASLDKIQWELDHYIEAMRLWFWWQLKGLTFGNYELTRHLQTSATPYFHANQIKGLFSGGMAVHFLTWAGGFAGAWPSIGAAAVGDWPIRALLDEGMPKDSSYSPNVWPNLALGAPIHELLHLFGLPDGAGGIMSYHWEWPNVPLSWEHRRTLKVQEYFDQCKRPTADLNRWAKSGQEITVPEGFEEKP